MSWNDRARKSVQRIRPYTPGKSIESVKREHGLTNVIKMASNENPLGPAVKSLDELADAYTAYYPDISASPLPQALADYLGLSVDHLIFGNGSDEVIQMLGLAFVNPGDQILSSECTFSEYRFVGDLVDATYMSVPMTDKRIDVDALIAKINPATKLIFIANPNNPTGTIITHAETVRLLEATPPGCVVVLDEAYVEYVTDIEFPKSLDLVQQYPNVILLRTFSKIYGLAALRIGYGVANPDMISVLSKVRQPFNINSLALLAATKALSSTSHVIESVTLNESGKRSLCAALDDIGLSYLPSQTNFIYITLPKPAKDVAAGLLKRGIIVRALDSFGCPDAIRVTIGLPEHNDAFVQALREVLDI